MTIKEFLNKIEDYTPTDYNFWAGLHRTHYNNKKTVDDTFLVVFPNPWPAQWRNQCSHTIDIEMWLGHVVDIKKTMTGEYQQDPYSPIDIIANLHIEANDLLASINTDSNLTVLSVDPFEFFDQPDGASVNSQVWLKIKASIRIWYVEVPEEIVYVVHNGVQVVQNDILIIN